MKVAKILWWTMLITFAVIFTIYNVRRDRKNERKYFEDLNLKLTGIVELVDLSYIPNGVGVVDVKIIESNKDFYDPRSNHEYYYCLIKNNKAEFYQQALYECAIGDTIKVDTRKRIFIIQNGAKRIKEDIVLMKYDKFFDYVRNKHQKF